ncbi:MAG: redoxin domain-containing protein [Gemmataceae bacterium]|nr:redoxin domain-containing protein [Gemmataceae bacterium]
MRMNHGKHGRLRLAFAWGRANAKRKPLSPCPLWFIFFAGFRRSASIFIVGVVLLAVSSSTAQAVERDLEGTVKISGGEVEVVVRHKDGRPAAGVQVRLVYARQSTIAAAGTDSLGRWVSVVTRPGPYEAIIEADAEDDNPLRLPFTAMDAGAARPFPWSGSLLGVACLVGASLLCYVGVRKPVGIGLLSAAGIGLLAWGSWAYWLKPMPAVLPPGPDVATSAREYLRRHDVKPLSEPLERLLADTSKERVKTQSHPLLRKSAPDFELHDHKRKNFRLHGRLAKGPVVLVFYYGYHCNHCVGQLFALHDDIAKFRELGAEVIAVSADPSEWTRARLKQYGEFAFPVLSDPGNKVAEAYGMFQSASGKTPDDLRHGTFVIGREGVVHWTQYGYEPFTGNPTLLFELAKLEGRLPSAK